MGWFWKKKATPDAGDVASRAICLNHVAQYAQLGIMHASLRETLSINNPDALKEFPEKERAMGKEFWEKLGGFRKHLSPWEREFSAMRLGDLTEQSVIDASWREESLQVLLWSLGEISSLPHYDTQVDREIFAEVSPDQYAKFHAKARLRERSEIESQRDLAELWHWRSRTRQLSEDGPPLTPSPEMLENGLRSYDDIVRMTAGSAHSDGLIPIADLDFQVLGKAYRDLTDHEWSLVRSITMERHFALNWLCGHAPNHAWDETPTDT